MNKKFSLEICSDLDFEGMVIDVSYETQTIASVNYDKGINNIEIEFLSHEKKLKFPIDDFLNALEKAKKIAIQCANEDEQQSR